MSRRPIITLAAFFGATAVAAGAFGAHALSDFLGSARLATWETAARYQLLHAVALLALAAADGRVGSRWTPKLWAGGVVIFSGSLYALCLLDIAAFGAVTPIGGVALIAGWISLGVGKGS